MEFWIDYSHTLRGHPTCGREHGHTAKVIVEVDGDVRGGDTYQDNMIMDFADMKAKCKATLNKLDHNHLNSMFKFPSSENISSWLFEQFSNDLSVKKVIFFEGNGKWCAVER